MDSNKQFRVSIIGLGKMGEAIISGLLKSCVYHSQDIQAAEIIEERREYISQKYKLVCYEDSKKAAAFGDIVILAVKPGDVESVLKQITPALNNRKILISIAAGVTIDFIQKCLPKNTPIIRVMPNLACSVNQAMITLCPSENITNQELQKATEVLGFLGRVICLEEKYLNLATGLVGSGPAYIFLIIDALADAGVRLGLPKDLSTLLAAQTTLGASKMVIDTGEHPMKLKDMVATPAGTTVEGLLELEKGKLRAVIISAVTEATKKAKGLQPNKKN